MVIALALVLANPPTPSADLGPRVRGKSFDGVIVRTADPEGWTPSAPQIEELESLLPGYVRSRVGKGGLQRPLFQYKRQYVGWLDHGRRLVIVTFFHDSTEIVKSRPMASRPHNCCRGRRQLHDLRGTTQVDASNRAAVKSMLPYA